MEASIGLLGLVVLVVLLIAWLLPSVGSKVEKKQSPLAYVEGLNFLLDDKPDRAVEAFMTSLDVNTDTLETHLALGKLMRRQGHVDRAIRIHQNVLARPSLAAADQHLVHLELAKDFMTAGLLDRAEMLLQEVIEESADLRSMAQRYLLELYQDESEWQQAIDIAKSLLQSKYVRSQPEEKKYITRLVSHFYCELASQSQRVGDIDSAHSYLNHAISTDKLGVRVAVLNAARLNAEGNFKQAIKSLGKISVKNPAWFSACLPTLLESHEGLFSGEGVEKLWQYLKEKSPSDLNAREVMFVVKEFVARGEDQPEKLLVAEKILQEYLSKNQNLELSNILLGLQLRTTVFEPVINDSSASLTRLHEELGKHIGSQKLYRCEQCGFSGRQLYWRCPSCKRWDSCLRIEEVSA